MNVCAFSGNRWLSNVEKTHLRFFLQFGPLATLQKLEFQIFLKCDDNGWQLFFKRILVFKQCLMPNHFQWSVFEIRLHLLDSSLSVRFAIWHLAAFSSRNRSFIEQKLVHFQACFQHYSSVQIRICEFSYTKNLFLQRTLFTAKNQILRSREYIVPSMQVSLALIKIEMRDMSSLIVS